MRPCTPLTIQRLAVMLSGDAQHSIALLALQTLSDVGQRCLRVGHKRQDVSQTRLRVGREGQDVSQICSRVGREGQDVSQIRLLVGHTRLVVPHNWMLFTHRSVYRAWLVVLA